MNARSLFVFGALLLSASHAYADGIYQRTRDNKTLVWNNYPSAGETVTWAGERDKDGYATGEGTVAWSTSERKSLTGTRLPFFKHTVVRVYSGKMVRGKLDGPVVTVKEKGKIFHATFLNGNKVGEWAAGPGPAPPPAASSPAVQRERDESVSPRPPDRTAIADQPRKEPTRQEAVVEAPAEGPLPTPLPPHPPPRSDSESVREQGGATRPTNQDVAKPAATEERKDSSLRTVIAPPSSLRTRGEGEASPRTSKPSAASSQAARPRLTQSAVIELANEKARTQGHNLAEYQRPQAQYRAADGTWSVSYEQKNDSGGMIEIGKQLSVTVEDKTKNTSIVTGR